MSEFAQRNASAMGLVVTGFYKRGGKCWAVFHNPDNSVSTYDVTDMVYKEFQKWVKKWMLPTDMRGSYMSRPDVQTRVRKMLVDHIAFPF